MPPIPKTLTSVVELNEIRTLVSLFDDRTKSFPLLGHVVHDAHSISGLELLEVARVAVVVLLAP